MPTAVVDRPLEQEHKAPPRDGARWRVLGLVALGTFMTTLDSSIVNISLPAIARAFGTPLSGAIEWVVIVYLVVIAALLLTFGRLSDIFGRKPIWLAGLGVFTCGSALCGLAPSLPVLIASRALQGIGGALIFAPSVAILTDAFRPEERGRAIGLNAMAVALGVSVGPLLGGVITEHLTWRWIFFVNVPVGIVAMLASARWLSGGTRKPGRLDPLGAVLLAVGLGGLTLALSFGQEWGWTSLPVIACLALAIASLAGLLLAERRVPEPNIDLDLFGDRAFSAALASLVLSFVALFAVSFLLPFYLENLRGFPPDQSGLMLTPLSLAIGVVAPLSGSLADRLGSRGLSSVGLALACVGLFFLSQIGTQTSAPDIIWRLALVGVGTGLFQSPNNRSLMQAAPRREQGEASGLLGTGRVVGQSLSVAIAGAVFAAFGGMAANARLADPQVLSPDQLNPLGQAFVTGFHNALLVCAGVAAIGILTSLVRPSKG
jgi:EmrB/QacA subfamily drug resistance transporter